MSAPSFTPGPWSAGRDSNYPSSFGIIEGASFPISYVLWATDVTYEMGKQRDRDAHLIAASPDLFAALETFVAEYVELVESGDAGYWDAEAEPKVIAARAALAKARGTHQPTVADAIEAVL
jgi:hypothetical protein